MHVSKLNIAKIAFRKSKEKGKKVQEKGVNVRNPPHFSLIMGNFIKFKNDFFFNKVDA